MLTEAFVQEFYDIKPGKKNDNIPDQTKKHLRETEKIKRSEVLLKNLNNFASQSAGFGFGARPKKKVTPTVE